MDDLLGLNGLLAISIASAISVVALQMSLGARRSRSSTAPRYRRRQHDTPPRTKKFQAAVARIGTRDRGHLTAIRLALQFPAGDARGRRHTARLRVADRDTTRLRTLAASG